MRIAHFVADDVDPHSGKGVPRSVYFTTLYQAQLGHDVAVFCIPPGGVVKPDGVEVFRFEAKLNPFGLPDGLADALLAWKPDILHMQSVYTPVLSSLASWARRNNIPYVSTPRGALSRHVTRRHWYIKLPYKYLVELPILNHAAFVQALTDHDDIKDYGVKVPIVPIVNGIALDELPQPLNTERMVQEYPQLEGKRIFVFIGRLDPFHKGLDLLLDAWAMARPQNSALVLIGPSHGSGAEELKAQAAELGISSEMIFHGPIYDEDKFNFLASSDVYVNPSRWEGGNPHAMMEASACYLASMISYASDRMELVPKYDAGVHVKLEVEDVAEKLTFFATIDAAELKTMGENARRLVQEEFNWTRAAQAICDAYVKYAGVSPS